MTAQLIRGDTDQHVWAEKYDRDVGDVLALLDEVSTAIANEIVKAVGETASLGRSGLRKPHQVIPKAYETYLRGLQLLNAGRLPGEPSRKGRRLL